MGSEHSPVGDEDHIGPKLLPPFPHKRQKARASDLLFPLHQELDVHRKRKVLQGRHVGPKLPLVVGGAPGVHPSLPHRGEERRGFPKLQGIRGLNVVVPVDQDRGGLWVQEPFRVEDGMQRRLVELGAKPQGLKPFLKP